MESEDTEALRIIANTDPTVLTEVQLMDHESTIAQYDDYLRLRPGFWSLTEQFAVFLEILVALTMA